LGNVPPPVALFVAVSKIWLEEHIPSWIKEMKQKSFIEEKNQKVDIVDTINEILNENPALSESDQIEELESLKLDLKKMNQKFEQKKKCGEWISGVSFPAYLCFKCSSDNKCCICNEPLQEIGSTSAIICSSCGRGHERFCCLCDSEIEENETLIQAKICSNCLKDNQDYCCKIKKIK